ncbi:MAG: hypothetical protein IPH07_24085 [Deltaproteobacteria bacterium]|nr:hypothetical protein [Deltaproteobacteria bacterium]MBK8720557.1 hypothetical protein [Deltaproteobacteria bacterium]MBP7292426.1 hypothetical protein [Nannocystaceae bacterium]
MIGLLLRLALDVRVASIAGAIIAGHPDAADRVVAIARRESGLALVGVHELDARWSRSLRPRDCAGHRGGWSTRGAHGQMAAYALQYLPAPLRCSPWLIDVPIVSAWVAARRATSRRCLAVSRCRSWAS